MSNTFPKIILVATSSPCNARCPHCPCTVKPNIRKTEKMFFPFKGWMKLVNECKGKKTAIRLSGYGEPLLHPQFMEMIDYGKKHDISMSLITNGSLFNKRKIDDLMDYEIDSIEISVDSHDPDIYSKIRVGLDFHKVKENIEYLVESRNRKGKKTCIMASIISQPSKNPKIFESAEYWGRVVDKVMIRKYVTWGILPEKDRVKEKEERQACPYPFERLMIDPDGYFRLCPYDDQKLILPFGHISKNKVKEVWLGKRFSEIRKNHMNLNFHKAELCSKCVDWAQRSWTDNYAKALKEARCKISSK